MKGRRHAYAPIMWTGELNPSPVDAKPAPVCKCERPMPVRDEERGRYCLTCSKRLPEAMA